MNDIQQPLLDVIYGIPKPTFGIYQANGQKKVGLKKAFIEVIDVVLPVDKLLDTITLKDGSVWPLFFDEPGINSRSFHANSKVTFIISFQVYDAGNYFAVARLYNDKSKS